MGPNQRGQSPFARHWRDHSPQCAPSPALSPSPSANPADTAARRAWTSAEQAPPAPLKPALEVRLKATPQGFVWEDVSPEKDSVPSSSSSSKAQPWLPAPEIADSEFLSVVDDNTIQLQDLDDNMSLSLSFDGHRSAGAALTFGSRSRVDGLRGGHGADFSRPRQQPSSSSQEAPKRPGPFPGLLGSSDRGDRQGQPSRALEPDPFRPGRLIPSRLHSGEQRHDRTEDRFHSSEDGRYSGEDLRHSGSGSRHTEGRSAPAGHRGAAVQEQTPEAEDPGFFVGTAAGVLEAGASVWGSLFNGLVALTSAPERTGAVAAAGAGKKNNRRC